MSEAKLTLGFDGPAVENGEMDVQAFAAALLSMGDLIQAVNTEIKGSRAANVHESESDKGRSRRLF